ncbi:MAG: hypothetical protein GKR90_06625 [Pseudomonadales bacterium]|nr:hypothetical protein [Pseudomonadales bacterium]
MELIAGTSRGVFRVEDGERLLDCRGVKEVVRIADHIFVGSAAGLYRSGDSGGSWKLVGFAESEVWQVRASGNRIWVSTQPAGLYFSDDVGDSWNDVIAFNNAPEQDSWCIPVDPILPGRARALVIHRDDPDQMLVGVEVGGIMRSEDGGETWSMVLPGDNPDLHMLFQHPSDPNVVFASTGYGRLDGVAEMIEGNAGVLRSDDFGATWHYKWAGITPRYSRPMCIDSGGLTVASAPTAFSHYKEEGGAGAMLFRSDDQGESWRSLGDESHSPSEANFHGLIADPEDIGAVYVGTDTGEVWHVSSDAHWRLCGSDMPAVISLLAA